jgi:hypothetical protein
MSSKQKVVCSKGSSSRKADGFLLSTFYLLLKPEVS